MDKNNSKRRIHDGGPVKSKVSKENKINKINKTNKTNEKQKLQFFFINLLSFAVIFLVIGVIVFQILTSSVYQSIDKDLTRMSTDETFLEMEISQGTGYGSSSFKSNDSQEKAGDNPSRNSFQLQAILWSKDGTILNADKLGSRYNDLQNIKLSTKKIGEIQNLTVTDSLGNETSFRSILIEVSVSQSEVTYIQLLTNTDLINQTVENFKKILIVCMLFFWLISIAISYYLARLNMAPIVKSWKKQQEFVENASHELRTPLTIIQSKLENLFTHPQHTIIEESESIAMALSETRRLTSLTNDLLLLARTDSNETVLHKELIDIDKFLKNVVEPFSEMADTQKKAFTLENEVKVMLSLDSKRIHQLLVILLDNALKYTKEKDEIKITSSLKNQNWQVQVIDTGLGIKEENKSQIFERFYREDGARQRETGGYGLGLPIAKWIVKSHGGTILVKDNEPSGTIFQFQIPYK